MNRRSSSLLLLVLLMLGACAIGPTGPSITVMPGPGVPFETFKADDTACRQWADQQIAGASPGETANRSTLGGALLGTLIGAGLGAAIGGAAGDAGDRGRNRRCRRGDRWNCSGK